MATEQSSTVTSDTSSIAMWASWIGAIVGLWVAVSPFVLSGDLASGNAMLSNVVGGIAIVVLAGYGAFALRNAADRATRRAGEWAGWIAAVAGLWVLVSTFVLSGAIDTGTPMWSNVVAGLVALVLAGYTGYVLSQRT